MDTLSEMTLISGIPKHHYSSNRVEAYRDQVINEVLTKIWLRVDLLGLLIHPVVISPVPSCTDIRGC